MANVPVMIGQRIMQLDPARAMELVRSGVARMLPPGMQTVGAQSAGAQASGPFYGNFSTNLPPLLQRPGLVGRGVAGAAGAGSMALGGGESPAQGRNPLFDELDRRGTAGASSSGSLMDQIMSERSGSPYGGMPPAGSFPGMTSMDQLRVPQQAAGASPYGSMPPAGSFPGMTSMDALRTSQPAARVPIPQQLFDVLSSYGAGAPMSQPPMSQPPMPVRQMDSTLFGEDVGARPAPMRAMDSTLAGYDMPPNVPLPPRRPADVGAPMQLASAAPSVRESFMQRLLSGPNYQSNSMPVVPQGGAQSVRDINFADPDNAADFFRAERALRALPEETLRMAGLLG